MTTPEQMLPLSPFNRRAAPERATEQARVDIHDITLREGQQAADVALSLEEQVELGVAVGETGVGYLQAGFAGQDDATVAALKAAGIASRVSVLAVAFVPDWEASIRSAASAGADVLEVLVRSSDVQMRAMGITREDGLRQAANAVSAAVGTGAEPWFIASFGTLAHEDHLLQLYRTAHEAGATRFVIADTTGIATPEAIAYLVERVSGVTDGGSVGVHCHEDFGLANALSLTGIAAGADLVEVSVNGYGERAGNCSLSQLALALELLYERPIGIDLGRLSEVERLASRLSRVPLAASQPVSGDNVFAQKLDIHVQLTKENPGLLEPFPPGLVGNRRRLLLGRGTGPIAVAAKARELDGRQIDAGSAACVAERVRAIAVQAKRPVTDAEFLALVHDVISSNHHRATGSRNT